MRSLLALFLLLTLPAAVAPLDNGTRVLASDSEARWVPFTLTPANQLVFAATLDGRQINALLDTGASASLMTGDYASRTGRKVTPRGKVAAIGGTVATGWTPITSLSFGGLTRTGGGMNVVTLPGTATGNGGAIELLIGRDVLDRFALDIDYANRRFRLLPSGRMPYTGTRLPLRLGNAPLAYVSEITIAGRKLQPIIVDTGDGTSLTLARGAWRTLPLAQQPAMTTQLAYGAGGQVIADIGVLPDVGLGARTARDVPVWVEQTGGFSDTARAAGRIGTGLLQRYRVLLDPGAGLMVLGTGGIDALPPRSTAGLQLALTGKELRVLHVMRGSPAETTGWKVGDSICAVNGRVVADDPAAAAQSQWLFGAPGTIVQLKLCTGENRVLTLRRFY